MKKLLFILIVIPVLSFSQKSIYLKSSTEIKLKLDSVIYQDFNHLSNISENVFKQEYFYDENNRFVLSKSYDWDKTINQWIVYATLERNYNPEGKLSTECTLYKGFRRIFVNDYKYEYIYNSDGLLIQMINSEWNDSNNQWEISKVYNYNDKGLLLSEEASNVKIEYSYDDNENKTHKYRYILVNNWILSNKTEYFYDSDGNLILQNYYSWDNSTSHWNISWKYEYSYINDNLVLLVEYIKDNSSPEPHYFSKKEYTYDSFNNILIYNHFRWDDDLNEWINNSREERTYDYTFKIEDLIIPVFDDDIEFEHKLTNIEYFKQNENNNQLQHSNDEIFYYSQHYVKYLPSYENEIIMLYPNPTNDFINIKLNGRNNFSVHIINLNGITVYKNNHSNNRINIENLPAGIYFCRVISPPGEKVMKFIKQ
jgi:hypothetical protein